MSATQSYEAATMMQAPFQSPMFNMFDNGTVAAPLADSMGIRRMGGGRNKRFMPTAPFGIPGQPQTTGYDSSGINPHNMYGGTFGQSSYPQFPRNPGGFLAQMFGRG